MQYVPYYVRIYMKKGEREREQKEKYFQEELLLK